MANIILTQAEADALIAMEKHRVSDERYRFPTRGESLSTLLHSPDRRENFQLDLSRGRIDLKKVTMQNRGRQVIALVRLDLGGSPHRNPDGKEIGSPHLHLYREGFADKWAYPLPAAFGTPSDIWTTFQDFLRYCNIMQPPHVERELFT